jgi:hypothetical protein
MNIPNVSTVDMNIQHFNIWNNVAARLSLKYNIYIGVKRGYSLDTYGNRVYYSIYFEVDGHKIDSLTELKRVLKLKAFL